MTDEEIAGASRSLQLTIKELEAYMAEDDSNVTSVMRQKVYTKIAEAAIWWANYGFQQGHREAYREQRDNGNIPPSMSFEVKGAWLAPGHCETTTLTSRIRRT